MIQHGHPRQRRRTIREEQPMRAFELSSSMEVGGRIVGDTEEFERVGRAEETQQDI